MSQKRILFLGGSSAQIPIINEAKQRGMYVITCDYLPNNPGHKLADEYHNISTIDPEGILNLAKRINVDFVVAYASDPAAPTAAYVSEILGLPGNSYKSVRILTAKDLFREFQTKNGFNAPKAISIYPNDLVYEKVNILQFPIIVKPTDSSGSKGVIKVDKLINIQPAINYAFSFSRNNRIIAEEFIDNEIADLHGDGFVIDGNLVFSCLGDHIYNSKSNPFNPIGTLWPSKIDHNIIVKANNDVARLIKLVGFKNGPINIEARVNREGMLYIMEIGPRSGGHFVPNAIKYCTGFNMVKATIDLQIGEEILLPKNKKKYSAYYAINSDEDGVLEQLKISVELKQYVREFHQYVKLGEKVKSFQGANYAIGIVLLVFNEREEMDYYISNISRFISIEIEKS